MKYISKKLSCIIFGSRWLQLPLYLGLIFALILYVIRFFTELWHLGLHSSNLNDTQIMLGILDLIDVVMIANLLIMVVIGGYETFLAPLILKPDIHKLEWLGHIDAGGMKVKLALSLIGISSIHLLRTFIDLGKTDQTSIMWQVLIHLTLIVSAIGIAFINRLLTISEIQAKNHYQ